MIEQFKWLHRHPELGDREYETTRFLTDILREHHIQLLDTGLETGAIAVVSGRADGPVVGLRADIDALPIREETGLPYASEHEDDARLWPRLLRRVRQACSAAAEGKGGGIAWYSKIAPARRRDRPRRGKRVVATGLLNDVQAFYAGAHLSLV